MIRKAFLFLFTLLCFVVHSQEKEVWPIKNVSIGTDIISKPQDYIDDELNFDNLIITSQENTTVIAPNSGIVKNILYGYRKSLIHSSSYGFEYNDSISVEKYDIEYRKSVGERFSINSQYISLTLGIQTKKGEVYYISGLLPTEYFKTGSTIKAGQVIGKMGYSYHKIKQPSIMFSRSVSSKSADPMSVFGLKSTFIPPQKNKINYLTYKHPAEKLKSDFTIFRESLEEGHPGLYDYTTKKEIDILFNNTYKTYTKPLTSEEFRISLLPIIKTIRDSHTAIFSLKQKKLSISLNSLLGSLNHMSVNRLFRNQQRTYEMLLYDFLVRFYNRQIGKEKQQMNQLPK